MFLFHVSFAVFVQLSCLSFYIVNCVLVSCFLCCVCAVELPELLVNCVLVSCFLCCVCAVELPELLVNCVIVSCFLCCVCAVELLKLLVNCVLFHISFAVFVQLSC